jgi:hypothetical protein
MTAWFQFVNLTVFVQRFGPVEKGWLRPEQESIIGPDLCDRVSHNPCLEVRGYLAVSETRDRFACLLISVTEYDKASNKDPRSDAMGHEGIPRRNLPRNPLVQ